MTSFRRGGSMNSQEMNIMQEFDNNAYYHTMAKRVLHSKHFKFFYLSIAILSFSCLMMV
jgi:hypothetical protein